MNDLEEGNKIIAKFTGSEIERHPDFNYQLWKGGLPFVHGKMYLANNLLFHTNWTWLMAAVSKIVEKGIIFNSNIRSDIFTFSFERTNEVLCTFTGSRSLYKIYLWEGVVETIKKLEDDKSN